MLKIFAYVHPISWLKLAIYSLLLARVYFSVLTNLVTHGWVKEDYTYAYLLPFVVLFMIWGKRFKLLKHSAVPSWTGLAPLIFGLSLFWLGELAGVYFVLYVSFWFVLIGLCLLHLGWKKTKTIGFALIVILTMFPLPSYFYNKMSVKLQLISSKLSLAMIQFYGMPAFRDGNIIDLGFTELQIIEACSGLRYLFPLIVLGLLLAYFFKAALWKRAILIISTVPLAIFANSMRISLTGILYKIWGARVAETFFHGFSGWLIFMFTLAVLFLEIWILGEVRPLNSGTSIHEKTSSNLPYRISFRQGEREPRVAPPSGEVKGRKGISFVLQPQFIVAIVLLSTTLAFSQGIEIREKIQIRKTLAQFPLLLSEWVGLRKTMEQRFIDRLQLGDYALIDYTNQEGKSVYFYVVYNESQSKGSQHAHTPTTCFRGSGWIVKDAGPTTISTPGYYGDAMKVNRAFIQKGDSTQLIYYWFPQRGRILTNVYQLKIFTFWDALTRKRTDGAVVRLITPVYKSEALQEAETRLQAFTRAIVPVLDEYIPGKDLG